MTFIIIKHDPETVLGKLLSKVLTLLQMSGIPLFFHLGKPPLNPALNEAFPEQLLIDLLFRDFVVFPYFFVLNIL